MNRTWMHPVWAGLAVRLADGTLWAVEMEPDVEINIEVSYDHGDPSVFSRGFETVGTPAMVIDVRMSGTGRNVARFSSDMGADKATKAIAEPVREITP